MSLPGFLVPEQTVTANGAGPAIELPSQNLIELTLGIIEVVEQESIDVTIHGSVDGAEWTPKPIGAFQQKFYPGISTIVWDPARYPNTKFIQARWRLNRWGHWGNTPVFRFYVFAAPAE